MKFPGFLKLYPLSHSVIKKFLNSVVVLDMMRMKFAAKELTIQVLTLRLKI